MKVSMADKGKLCGCACHGTAVQQWDTSAAMSSHAVCHIVADLMPRHHPYNCIIQPTALIYEERWCWETHNQQLQKLYHWHGSANPQSIQMLVVRAPQGTQVNRLYADLKPSAQSNSGS